MDGQQLKDRYELRWGQFRRFIAAKPLTGFFIGIGVGVVLSRVLGLFV